MSAKDIHAAAVALGRKGGSVTSEAKAMTIKNTSPVVLITPPENQGQIVELSFGWHEGRLYCRSLDRSNGSAVWAVADEDASNRLPDEWHPVNCQPDIAKKAWKRCAEPRQ